MNTSSPLANPDLSEWNADLLRLTVFVDPQYSLTLHEADDWWKRIVGEDPETKVRKPKSSELVDSGPFHRGVLVLQIRHGGHRVDWYYADPVTTTLSSNEPKPLVESLDLFSDVASRWLGTSKAVSRVAFGALLSLPVPDMATAYKWLSGYLGLRKIDPENTSEVLYQINRPRESQVVPGTRLNRLNKWSLFLEEISKYELLPDGPSQTEEEKVINKKFTLELDINNVPVPKATIKRDRLQDLFAELVELGREIIRNGDIP